MFGDLCNLDCHCKDNAACDKDTGICSNRQCAPEWVTLSNNQCQRIPELPSFSSTNPQTVLAEATQVTVRWRKWNDTSDIGDGPIEAYRVYYRQTVDSNWTLYVDVAVHDPHKTNYSTTIIGLQWSTSYDFSVTTVRPNGEGNKDTYTTVTTLCGVPSNGPEIKGALSSHPNEIHIAIEVPTASDIKCRVAESAEYITSFLIRYKKTGGDQAFQYKQEPDANSRFFMIGGLQPSTEYEIQFQFNNKDEASPWSSPSTVRTATAYSYNNSTPVIALGILAALQTIINIIFIGYICKNRFQHKRELRYVGEDVQDREAEGSRQTKHPEGENEEKVKDVISTLGVEPTYESIGSEAIELERQGAINTGYTSLQFQK